MTPGSPDPGDPDDPVARLDAALASFGLDPAAGLAVAVSGGGDSLALMHLLADWCAARGRPGPLVLTVDHGLRPEAADEARGVVAAAAARGLDARILTLRPGARAAGDQRVGNLQADLRAARYEALAAACAEAGIADLFLAHTRDDQAETFLMRLARGSGVDGLAAMAATRRHGALRLRRPLLGVDRAALRGHLIGRGATWIEDPGNANPAFARARWRALTPLLAAEGLDARRLARTAEVMARARRALEAQARALAAEALVPEPWGSLLLDARLLALSPEEAGLRVLSRALRHMAGGPPLRLDRLVRVHAALSQGTLARPLTLRGCRLLPRGRAVRIAREPRAVEGPRSLAPGAALMWDHRFRVALPPGEAHDLRVEALGASRWAALAARHPDIPAAVGPSLPVIVDALGAFALPLLERDARWGAQVTMVPVEDESATD